MTIDPATRSPLTTNTVAAKRKQIEELRKRILAGEDFATLAKQYSEDPARRKTAASCRNFRAARWCRNLNPPLFR